MKEQAAKVIREVLGNADIAARRIVLFGSRARGDFREDSDLDFLVLVADELSFAQKHELEVRMRRALAALRIPNDIIIQTEERFDQMKGLVGNISYCAAREGVEV